MVLKVFKVIYTFGMLCESAVVLLRQVSHLTVTRPGKLGYFKSHPVIHMEAHAATSVF